MIRRRATGTKTTVHFVRRPMRRFRLSGDIGCAAAPVAASATRMPSFSFRGDWPGDGGGVNMKESDPKEREGKECGGEKTSLYILSIIRHRSLRTSEYDLQSETTLSVGQSSQRGKSVR